MALYKDFDNIILNESSKDKKAIWQSIENILTTTKGSLAGKPDFGCNLKGYCFEIIDHLTVSDIQSEVRRALTKYEPRIIVKSVDVYSQPEFNRVIISISFKYSNVNTQDYETLNITIQP